MKLLRQLLLTAIFTISLSSANAQEYATLDYWGKEVKLDRQFFEILNANYGSFMSNTATTWRYYDYNDYQNIYISIVEHLKRVTFVIHVSEANQLTWSNSFAPPMPGQTDEIGRNKKSKARAGWMLYHVLLPSLQSFAKAKL